MIVAIQNAIQYIVADDILKKNFFIFFSFSAEGLI